MPSVGFDTRFRKQCPTVFIVKNTAIGNKCIRLFSYPISNGQQRDLLSIPYVSEADIRHSLLKGELYIKIITNEIRVTQSNIDLLQFDACHKDFLMSAGITEGLEVLGTGSDGYGANLSYLWRNEIELIGAKNDSNRSFMIPGQEKFIDGDHDDNEFHISIDHNGRRLIQNTDFIIQESGGIGTGYDTVRFLSFVPGPKSKIIADYVVEA